MKKIILTVVVGVCVALSARSICFSQQATVAESTSAKAKPTEPEVDPTVLKDRALKVLDTYCVSCHGPEKRKGNVRLDALETIDAVDLQALYSIAEEMVHLEKMPPAKAKQPSKAERKALTQWFNSQLTGDAAKKLAEKLLRPEAGNYVDHEDLFSGEYADLPGFTYDRRWLISEFIFDAKMQRIVSPGRPPRIYGQDKINGLSLANPFLLPEESGVRYYANVDLTGGHLSTMLSNAQKTSIFFTEKLGSVDNIWRT